jgi:hypothetical protein
MKCITCEVDSCRKSKNNSSAPRIRDCQESQLKTQISVNNGLNGNTTTVKERQYYQNDLVKLHILKSENHRIKLLDSLIAKLQVVQTDTDDMFRESWFGSVFLDLMTPGPQRRQIDPIKDRSRTHIMHNWTRYCQISQYWSQKRIDSRRWWFIIRIRRNFYTHELATHERQRIRGKWVNNVIFALRHSRTEQERPR